MSLLTPKVQPGQYDQVNSYQIGWNHMLLIYTSGASGAIPSALTYFSGVESVTHDGTGLLHLVTDSIWTAVANCNVIVLPTGGAYDATKAMRGDVFAVDLPNRTIKFATVRPDTGAATDTASGDVVIVELDFLWNAKNTPGLGI